MGSIDGNELMNPTLFKSAIHIKPRIEHHVPRDESAHAVSDEVELDRGNALCLLELIQEIPELGQSDPLINLHLDEIRRLVIHAIDAEKAA